MRLCSHALYFADVRMGLSRSNCLAPHSQHLVSRTNFRTSAVLYITAYSHFLPCAVVVTAGCIALRLLQDTTHSTKFRTVTLCLTSAKHTLRLPRFAGSLTHFHPVSDLDVVLRGLHCLHSPCLTATKSVDFVEGLHTVGGSGSVESKSGFAVHVYMCNTSMVDKCFNNSDGDLLFGKCWQSGRQFMLVLDKTLAPFSPSTGSFGHFN